MFFRAFFVWEGRKTNTFEVIGFCEKKNFFLKTGACFPSHPFPETASFRELVEIQFLVKRVFRYSQSFLLKNDESRVFGEWPHGSAARVV